MHSLTVAAQAARGGSLGGLVVQVTWSWDPSDPYAVSMEAKGGPVWTFDRDLLGHGVIVASGIGDVQIRPYGDEITLVHLRSPHGAATLEFRRADLVGFLQGTYDAIRPGCEHMHIDWDTELQHLGVQ